MEVKRVVNYIPSINYLKTLNSRQFIDVISDSIQNLYGQILEIVKVLNTFENIENNNVMPDIGSVINIDPISNNWIINGKDTGVSAKGKDSVISFDTLTDEQKAELKGEPGTSVLIRDIEIKYAKHTSGTSIPTGSNVWKTDIPNLDPGEYLWTRTIVTFSDNQTIESYSVSRNGTNGSMPTIGINNNGFWTVNGTSTGVKAQGNQGDKGDPGNGINTISIAYNTNGSGTTPPENNWTQTIPTVQIGDYLWTRVIINYTNSTSSNPFYITTRNPLNGSGGGGNAQTMSVNPITNGTTAPSISASPNVMHKISNVVRSINVTLTASSANEVGEYVFRFKTDTSNIANPFFNFNGANVKYPFDYVINPDTEYTVVLTYDGSSYLLNCCAYQ